MCEAEAATRADATDPPEYIDTLGQPPVTNKALAASSVQAAGGSSAALAADALLLSRARAYLLLRALGAPAASVGLAAAGAYRGLRDTRTPLRVAAGASLLNVRRT